MTWAEVSPRERDALVATEVMGWRVKRHPDGLTWLLVDAAGWVRSPDIAARIYGGWDTREAALKDVPLYTTDIAAAWEVVEKMEGEGWATGLDSDGAGVWSARFWMGDTFHDSPYVDAAPEAICIAALRAKGIDVGTA